MAIETVACPVCKRDVPWADNPFRPFCSERCRLIDLGKWADESYRLPASGSGGMAGDGEGSDPSESR